MTWGISFRLRQYLKGSLWVLPLAGGLAGVLAAVAAGETPTLVELPASWRYSAGTAQAVLAAVVGATVALTGFAVTVSVLVVQMTTSAFSARYMRLFYRDRALKAVLAVLIGTFTFSYALLRRVEEDSVPNFGVTLAGTLLFLGVLLFVVFLDRFLHRLRPVAIAALVASAGRGAFRAALDEAAGVDAVDIVPAPFEPAGEPTLVVRSGRAGAIQAMDTRGLAEWAEKHGSLLVLRHPVGDFVPAGATLLTAYGGTFERAVAERQLGAMLALGTERTIEQDPAFAVRILVDIANRALSPALNDPTTAVQVLDHLEDMLHLVGTTDLARRIAGQEASRTQGLVVPVRRWADYLLLGVTEIRQYGASHIQVMRRLRSLLEDLRDAVPSEHRSDVEAELARLDATVALHWGGSVDLALASAADRQGIGGPHG